MLNKTDCREEFFLQKFKNSPLIQVTTLTVDEQSGAQVRSAPSLGSAPPGSAAWLRVPIHGVRARVAGSLWPPVASFQLLGLST